MKQENKLDVEGSGYESVTGKSKLVKLKVNNQILDENISSITNLWSIEKDSDRTKDKVFVKIKEGRNYYIRSIELGTEFLKNTEVEVKLKKAEIDFVEK